MAKPLILKEGKLFELWTDESFPENVGIIWDEEYAKLIEEALKEYKNKD